MDEEQVKIDPENALFAKTMEIATLIGIIIMVGAGIVYFSGLHDMVSVHSAVQNWDKAAPEFWEATTGNKVGGYSWFADHLTFVDGVAVLGVAFLAFIPLLSMFVALFKANRVYKIVLGILIVEFLIVIIRPLF